MDLNPKIVDTAGRERFTFGGAGSAATGVHRGFCWSREWIVGAKTTEPMLAIWPLGMQADTAGVFGICLSSVGKYLTVAGGAMPECKAMAKRALLTMFDRPALAVDVSNLVDLIVRHLPDVILMTPTPRQVRMDAAMAPLIDVELKDESTQRLQSKVSI